MALANNEFFEKVKAATYSGDDKQVRAIYQEVFGSTIKKECGNCYNEAVYRLHSWLKANQMKQTVNTKWKFKKEFEGKTIVVKVGGVNTSINSKNLTDELAEMLINMGRGNNLELNKGYNPNVANGVVKKLTPEVFANAKEKEISPPTLSTLKVAEIDGNEQKENVSEKELNTEELKQSQEVKRKPGRPKKTA